MNSIISIRVRMVGMPAVRAFIYVIEKYNRMLQPPVYAKKLYIFLELSTS